MDKGSSHITGDKKVVLGRKGVKAIDRTTVEKANAHLAPKIEANQRMLAESARIGAKFFVGS